MIRLLLAMGLAMSVIAQQLFEKPTRRKKRMPGPVRVSNKLRGESHLVEMTHLDAKAALEGLRRWLTTYTACSAQDGWPCGSCTVAMLAELGVLEDGEYNEPRERVNELWRGILQMRKEAADLAQADK